MTTQCHSPLARTFYDRRNFGGRGVGMCVFQETAYLKAGPLIADIQPRPTETAGILLLDNATPICTLNSSCHGDLLGLGAFGSPSRAQSLLPRNRRNDFLNMGRPAVLHVAVASSCALPIANKLLASRRHGRSCDLQAEPCPCAALSRFFVMSCWSSIAVGPPPRTEFSISGPGEIHLPLPAILPLIFNSWSDAGRPAVPKRWAVTVDKGKLEEATTCTRITVSLFPPRRALPPWQV